MTWLWSALTVIAVLWPARALGAIDGLPLNGGFEALLVGLVLPTLWWFDRDVLQRRWFHAIVVALLVVKSAGLLLTPQGLCARFFTTAPLIGETHTIPIEEPGGWLRSWDVRADWRAETPRCTAIVDRPYRSAAEFPAWFLNLLDPVRPGRKDLALALTGYVRVPGAGSFTMQAGDDMRIDGSIGTAAVAANGGESIAAPLPEGTHPIDLRVKLTGERWQLDPQWNGSDAWDVVTFTTAQDGSYDRVARAVSFATTALSLLLAGAWASVTLIKWRHERALLAWSAVASVVLSLVALDPRLARLAPVILIGALFVPVLSPHRNLRGAFLLLGVPWLVFFATRATESIGRFTAYSHDDWLAYQVAGYRIFMNGYWLEAGSPTFDYQPLYRWISGALHLVFGDSSVGEIFVDAAALLSGGLLAFWLAKSVGGFRYGLFAGAITLVTFAAGTPWYFVGRGLSETVGAGFAFLASFFLLKARLDRTRAVAMAALFGVLTFYTRLNYLIFAVTLVALLLPMRIGSTVGEIRHALHRLRRRPAAIYTGSLVAAVLLFMTRTWWYTGHFDLFYGTSLKNNDVGLRFSTLASAEQWQRIGHSLSSLLWMNEPPAFDPRALIVAAGAVVVILAALQVPMLRRVPAAIVLVTAGAFAAGFVVHTHNYPGRMSIPLVPFAAAAAAAGAHYVAKAATMRRTEARAAA